MRTKPLIGPLAPNSPCDNLNHRRPHAALRHCATCGEVVNPAVAIKRCSKARHTAARLRKTEFCLDCGVKLIPSD